MRIADILRWIDNTLTWTQNRPGPAILWLPIILPVLLFLLILSKLLLIISPMKGNQENDNPL